MKSAFAIRVTAAAFLACGLSGWTSSRLLADQKPRAPGAVLKGDPVAAPGTVEARRPGHLGTIVGGVEDRDPDFGEAITRAFRRAPVPPSRRIAFAMFDQPSYRVDGWSVQVRDAEDVPGGKLVKVGVAPLLSSTLGASTVVLGEVIEWYRFDGTGLQLLKTEPPAGQPPATSLIFD